MRIFGMVAVALLAAVLLAVTNPNPAEFDQFLQARTQQQIARQNGNDPLSVFGSKLGAWLFSGQARLTTKWTDYTLFSVYSFTANGEEYRWVGILKQFIPLPPGGGQ